MSNCSQLQHELNNAESGDVITLAAVCTENNSGTAKGSFNLPSAADLTIQGQNGMTAGFEGVGVAKRALEGKGNGLVLRNLVVEGYLLKNEAAVKLYPSEGALPVIESDRFVDDIDTNGSSSSDRGGALNISAYNSTCAFTAPLSITSSDFEGDQVTDTYTKEPFDAGGGVYAEINCGKSAATSVDFATLRADTFTDDSIDTDTGREAFGGALYLANRAPAEVSISATQSDDVFEADTIASSTPTKAYGGGGEWASGIVLTSTADRFVKDALPGPQGASASSEGAGLGVISPACAEATTASAVLNNAVLAANAIGTAGEDGASEGAGIFAACQPTHPKSSFHLALNDSTVAENQAPNGISGIDGEESDQLTLSNSIVWSPPGQADVGGFQPVSGGLLTSLFSDVCKPDTSAVLPGEGNICANPLLADNGNPSSGEVYETYASPTIDAGSNALVPSGVTTDAFGSARILFGHVGCGSSGSLPLVDMGAAEFDPGVPSCPSLAKSVPPSPPRPGLTQFVSLKAGSTSAALTLSCSSTDGLGCSGTIFVTSDETLQGEKVLAVTAASPTKVSVRLSQESFSLPAGATATIQLKLNSAGLELLHRFHAISAFVVANEASPTSTPFIFLFHTTRFTQPSKPKSKKHKRRHSKHSKHR